MGLSPALIPFGEWAPDLTALGTEASPMIRNVVPQGDGYGPFPSFSALSTTLPAPCRGYIYARNPDGSVTVFAGTLSDLYKLNNGDFTWTNVSKGGVSYAGLPSGYHWKFVQFNNKVIAVQQNTVPQVFDLSAPATFDDLAGSPPQAGNIAVINRFIVLTQLLSFPFRVQWSGLNQPTTWDNVTAQSNYQDLADGGITIGVAGNDQFGILFQDSAIRNMIFVPGSPVVFDILKIAVNDGALSANAIITAGEEVYFCSPQGFKVIQSGGYPIPIAREKIDRTFFADIDRLAFQYFIGAIDPSHTRVFWAYKSNAGAAGAFDTILCYDRVLKKWVPIAASGQYLATLAKPGLTLENLDPIAPGALTITGAANNGSGAIRLTVASTATLSTGQIKAISLVTGTTEANGNWTITVVDATHFDLQGSAFVHGYAGGGVVGGSLDALPFSLDDVPLSSIAQLSMFSTSNALGFFSGANLEATLETPEQDALGRRVFISGLRPMTNAPGALCSVAARNTAQAASVYSTETSVNAIGVCPQRVETRYARAKLRIPAGDSWTYARGIQPEFRMTGTR